MPRGAEGPRDATACRYTARSNGVQRNRAMPRAAEGALDATRCRETARSYGRLELFCSYRRRNSVSAAVKQWAQNVDLGILAS